MRKQGIILLLAALCLFLATPWLLSEAQTHYRVETGWIVDLTKATIVGTSDNVPEGAANKYLTDAGFNSKFAAKTTDNLAEGTVNKYFSGKTTDNLPEGSANKYFSGKTLDDLPNGTANVKFGLNIDDAEIAFGTGAGQVNTDDIPEGATNKYNPFGAAIDSSEIADGAIANVDVSGTAAISRSKLDFGTGLANADVSATAAIAESKLALTFATHSNTNDPTTDEKAALVGTSGVPSTTNKYVTNADVRNSDARTPIAHNLGGGQHNADTLANLNLKVSDATLIDTGDSRLSDARPPTGAAGGSLAGTYPNPSIASATVGTGALKTATGVATFVSSNGNLTLNDYSFFPSLSVTTDRRWGLYPAWAITDPGVTVGRFGLLADVDGTVTIRWRYMTASDEPTVWIMFDKSTGVVVAVWMSDDPIIAKDFNGDILQENVPGLGAVKPNHEVMQLPLADLNIMLDMDAKPSVEAIKRGKKKSSRPEVEPYRIAWETFKNPAEELTKRCKVDIIARKLIAGR